MHMAAFPAAPLPSSDSEVLVTSFAGPTEKVFKYFSRLGFCSNSFIWFSTRLKYSCALHVYL